MLVGSLTATLLATVLLRMRNAKYRKLWEAEERDEDENAIPDIDEQDDPAHHRRLADRHEKLAAEHRARADALEAGDTPGTASGT